MAKIIGNAIATPNPRPDWNQTDETKADYIRNKPILGNFTTKSEVEKSDLALDVQATLDKADSAIQPTEGKTLSSNDYTDDEKMKLANIEDGAQVNVQADWNQTDTTKNDYIKNKPIILQADWNQIDATQNDYVKNKPTVVTGGIYEWNYVESETPLGVEESSDGLELTIFAMSFAPEVIVSDIQVNNRMLDGSLGVDEFEIYAKCQTDNNGYIEWITGLGEAVSYPLTTEYQKFSSVDTSVFSIRCTDIVTLSVMDAISKVGLVSIGELSRVHKDMYQNTTSISKFKDNLNTIDTTLKDKVGKDEIFKEETFGWTEFEYTADEDALASVYDNEISAERDYPITIHCAGEVLGFTAYCNGSYYRLKVNGEYVMENTLGTPTTKTYILPLTLMTEDIVIEAIADIVSFTNMTRRLPIFDGNDITVDTELNESSDNPIANSAVAKAISDIDKTLEDKSDINHIHPLVSIETNIDGFMSVVDKQKLDNIETIYATKEELNEKISDITQDEMTSIIVGSNNTSFSNDTVIMGNGNYAGAKGYYYKAIDLTNKKIYLSNEQVLPVISTDDYTDTGFETPAYITGNGISLVNDNKYDYNEKCSAIISSVTHNVVIYEGELGFTDISDVTSQLSIDDYSFCVYNQPEVGVVDIREGSVAFGINTKSTGLYSFAEGGRTHAAGSYSHTEGVDTYANYGAHAEGKDTKAYGYVSHTEGQNTQTNGSGAHAEGLGTTAFAEGSHTEGYETMTEGIYSHAEGQSTIAFADGSHTEGYNAQTYGKYSHAEGKSTNAIGEGSHAEGLSTIAYGTSSHTEGEYTETAANYSGAHAEGRYTIASGHGAHAEGFSHTSAQKVEAIGYGAHAEGVRTKANGEGAHTEGKETKANGTGAHAEGYGTIASKSHQHVQGKYNKTGNFAHIVGNGTGDSEEERKNIHTLDWEGNAWFAGDVTNGDGDSIASLKDRIVALEAIINNLTSQ